MDKDSTFNTRLKLVYKLNIKLLKVWAISARPVPSLISACCYLRIGDEICDEEQGYDESIQI